MVIRPERHIGKTYIIRENIGTILKNDIFKVTGVTDTDFVSGPTATVFFLVFRGTKFLEGTKKGAVKIRTIERLCDRYPQVPENYAPRPKSW